MSNKFNATRSTVIVAATLLELGHAYVLDITTTSELSEGSVRNNLAALIDAHLVERIGARPHSYTWHPTHPRITVLRDLHAQAGALVHNGRDPASKTVVQLVEELDRLIG